MRFYLVSKDSRKNKSGGIFIVSMRGSFDKKFDLRKLGIVVDLAFQKLMK